MQKVLRLFQNYWLITLLLLFTFLLRIYKIEELFYFTYDESIPAFVARRLILDHHIPLIGGVTPFGVHLTPYFYWFLAPILFLGNLNPISWGWAGALIATVTTIMIFIIGKEFANKKVVATAAIFWTFSYIANIYDRHLWALFWGPLLSLVVIFSLNKIIKKRTNFTFVLTLAIVAGIAADPSNVVFIILTIFVWIYYKIPFSPKTALSILLVACSLAPLFLFDLRHNFANSKPFLNYLKQTKESRFQNQTPLDKSLIFPNSFARLAYTFGDNEVAKQYSYCPAFVQEKYKAIPAFVTLAFIIILLSFIYWSFRINNLPGWKLIGFLLIIYFLGIQIYGQIFKGDIFEHYITGLFPVFLLIIAKYLSKLPKPIWLLTLAIFVSFNLLKLSQAKNKHGLTAKREAIEYTMQKVGNSDFSLDSLSTCWKYSGYRYLFAVFGREPVKSYVDPNFAYLYGSAPVAAEHPDTVVSFVIHDYQQETEDFYKRYVLLKSHETASSLFGNIEVIVMDNKTMWFDKNAN